MDMQSGLATRQDLDYLQTQMKNVYATQAEHADRLMRLEQRPDGDSRFKSAWGNQSPFPGLLNGTPQQDPNYNPAAEAFKHFDQDQSSSMMGSLNLDTEEEPRRGASRANSVRFDESAIHGHFSQTSRAANDFLPSRTGSAFGTHPLGERSMSHKSDGRQSSTHSARASSIGNESRPLSATVPSFTPGVLPTGPPPGLFILGPVPSIIRCWLNTNYSTDSLLYAAVCTGSYKSFVNERLLDKLGFTDQINTSRQGVRSIKLPVYLPEATIQQSSSRSASPAPQLPTLTTDFVVQVVPSEVESIDILLGCDVLRFRNADIHFSLDRLTVFDDERNKVSVPLVRPENARLFRGLQTTASGAILVPGSRSPSIRPRPDIEERKKEPTTVSERKEQPNAPTNRPPTDKVPTSPPASPSVIDEVGKASIETHDEESLKNGTSPDTPSKPENGQIWGSWRRDSAAGNRAEGNMVTASSASGYQRASRGRGMKVLKPARLNTARTPASPAPVGFNAMTPRIGEASKSTATRKDNGSPLTAGSRRSSSVEAQPPLSSKPSSSNPIGGASAFGWLNSAQRD